MKSLKKDLIIKIVLIIVGIVAAIAVFKNLTWIIQITMSPEKFRKYIVSLGNWGIVAYLSFQALQTIVAPIPGEVIQAASGYIYGGVLGTIYSALGMMLGAVIAFYFTKFIAFSFVEKIVKHKSARWLMKLMNSKNFSVIMLVMFIVPGMPKDFLIYMAALTPIKPSKFFMILLAGRLPGIVAAVWIGSSIHHKNYVLSISLVVITVICVILGFIYKNKIINKFSKKEEYTLS